MSEVYVAMQFGDAGMDPEFFGVFATLEMAQDALRRKSYRGRPDTRFSQSLSWAGRVIWYADNPEPEDNRSRAWVGVIHKAKVEARELYEEQPTLAPSGKED